MRRDASESIEFCPLGEIRRLQDELLVEQLAYVADRSSFYQRKFAEHGLRPEAVRSVDDLGEVPFTVKDEIRQSLDRRRPLGDHCAADLADVMQFHASSGTSGKPAYVGLTKSDLDDWIEIIRRSLICTGFRPGDRIVQAFGMSRGWVGGLPVVQGARELGLGVIPIGAEPGTTWLLNVIRDLEPVGLLSTPSFAIYLGEQAEAILGIPATELSIRTIYTGGEPGGGIPAIRDYAQALWGGAEMREVMGGTDLAPVLWAECEDQTGMHFIAPDSVVFELVSLDSQESLPVERGVVGEVVYTHLRRQACPVMRFRHGDVVEVIDVACSCGRTGPKIRCIGRTDDMFIVKGVNVYPSSIQEVVTSLRPKTTGSLKILKESPEYSIPGPLRIRVERSDRVAPSEESGLAAQIERMISEICRCRAIVEILPPGTYPPPGREKPALVEATYGSRPE